MIGQILRGRPHLAISACRPDRSALAAILDVLAELISQRLPVDLARLYGDSLTSRGRDASREGGPRIQTAARTVPRPPRSRSHGPSQRERRSIQSSRAPRASNNILERDRSQHGSEARRLANGARRRLDGGADRSRHRANRRATRRLDRGMSSLRFDLSYLSQCTMQNKPRRGTPGLSARGQRGRPICRQKLAYQLELIERLQERNQRHDEARQAHRDRAASRTGGDDQARARSCLTVPSAWSSRSDRSALSWAGLRGN